MIKFLILSLAVTIPCVVSEKDAYSTKFDKMNVDEILKSDRLLRNYIDCVLDKGRCTPEGKELKSHIQDALETECVKCSDAQRQGAHKVVHYLIEHKRDWWNELEAKFDPDGEYRKKYEEIAKKDGIDLSS